MNKSRKYILSDVMQKQKDKQHRFPLICGSYFQIFRCEYTIWSDYRNQESKKGPCCEKVF